MSCKVKYGGKEYDESELGNIGIPDVPGFHQQTLLKQGQEIILRPTPSGRTKLQFKDDTEVISLTEQTQAFRVNPSERKMSSAEKAASVFWKSEVVNGEIVTKIPKDTKISTPTEGFVTYDEFVLAKTKRMAFGETKGNLYHKIMEHLFDVRANVRAKAATELTEMITQRNLPPALYDWLLYTGKVENASEEELLEYARTLRNQKYLMEEVLDSNIFTEPDASKKDRILTEVKFGSKILGYVGRADMLIESSEGYLTLADFKAGRGLKREFINEILKFGTQPEFLVTDNQLHRAKLAQVLTALAMKVENPGMKFKKLTLAWIPDEITMREGNDNTEVEIKPYLEMVREYFKENKAIWEQLEALPHFKELFDPNTYNATLSSELENELKDNNRTPAEQMDLLRQEISKLSFITSDDAALVKYGSKAIKDAREQLQKKIPQLFELTKTVGEETLSESDGGMGVLESWFGSMYDTTDPFIKSIFEFKLKQEQKARDAYDEVRNEHDSKLEKVYKEYLKRKGKILAKIPIVNQIINTTKYTDLYDFLYINDVNDAGEIIKQRIAHTPAEFEAKEVELGRALTDAEKDYAKFLNNHYSKTLSGRDSYINQKKFRVQTKRGIEMLSPLDIHNGLGEHVDSAETSAFEYYSGMFPKYPRTIEEVLSLSHPFNEERGKGSLGKKLKLIATELWKQGFTRFYENTVEQWNNPNEIIPLKGLGSPLYDSSLNYTLDANEQFQRFSKDYYNKQYLDDVFGFARGIKIYLEAKNNNPHIDKKDWTETVNFIRDVILEYQLRGRKQQNFSKSPLTRSGIFNPSKAGKKFDAFKFVESVKRFTNYVVMSLNVPSGFANGIFANMVTVKKALSGSILKRINPNFVGVSNKKSIVDFSMGDLIRAGKIWGKMQAAEWNGELHKDPTWLKLQKLGILSNFSMVKQDRKELIATTNKGLRLDTLMFAHRMPEEFVSAVMAIAPLKNMKFKVDGKEVSAWDMYEVKVKQDKDGNDVHYVEWKRDASGKPVVRGQHNVSTDRENPKYEDLTELTAKELGTIRYMYQKLHGGYSRDMHSRLEYYLLSSLFTQFRRYMVSLMRGGFMSRGYRADGKFIATGETIDGKDIYEWTVNSSEGRISLIMKWGAASLGLMNTKMLPRKIRDFLGIKGSESGKGYKWREMSDGEKKIILEFGLTMLTWVPMMLAAAAKFKDDDKDDQYKKYVNRILRDYVQHYDPVAMAQTAKQIPVAIKIPYATVTGILETTYNAFLLAAGDEDAVNSKGHLRGSTKLQNNLPLLRGARQLQMIYTNSKDPDSIIDLLYRK